MISFKKEGGAYKSGLNILGSLHWKCPYFGLVHVSVNLEDGDVVRKGFRLRFWSKGLVRGWQGPKLFNYSAEYNFIEHRLDKMDCVAFKKDRWETYKADRQVSERKAAHEAAKTRAWAEYCKNFEGPRNDSRAKRMVRDRLPQPTI